MTREIRLRLQKLERQFQRPERENLEAHFDWFIDLAIGYYLGNPTTSDEWIREPYARALGYRHTFDFQKACFDNDPDLKVRNALAKDRLFAKFGVSKEDDRDAVGDAFIRMLEGFSERYRQHFQDGIKRWASGILASFGGCVNPAYLRGMICTSIDPHSMRVALSTLLALACSPAAAMAFSLVTRQFAQPELRPRK